MAHTEIPELKDYQRNRNDIQGRKHFKDALGRWHDYHERERLGKVKTDKSSGTPPKSLPKPKEGYAPGPLYSPSTWRSKEPLTETRSVGSGRSKKDVTFYRIPGTNEWGGPNSVARSQQEAILFNELPPSLRGDTIQDLPKQSAALKKSKESKDTADLERYEFPDENISQTNYRKQVKSNTVGEVEGTNKNKFDSSVLTIPEERALKQARGSVLKNKARIKQMNNYMNIPDLKDQSLRTEPETTIIPEGIPINDLPRFNDPLFPDLFTS